MLADSAASQMQFLESKSDAPAAALSISVKQGSTATPAKDDKDDFEHVNVCTVPSSGSG